MALITSRVMFDTELASTCRANLLRDGETGVTELTTLVAKVSDTYLERFLSALSYMPILFFLEKRHPSTPHPSLA